MTEKSDVEIETKNLTPLIEDINELDERKNEINTSESLDSINSDETIKPDNLLKEELTPEWTDLLGSGSILKKIIKEGAPDSRPKRLENCKIRYECSLEEGIIVEKVDELILQLGDCEVSYMKQFSMLQLPYFRWCKVLILQSV